MSDVRPAEAAPYFEDLELGSVPDGLPTLTLTEGHAAVHQAILGDSLRLPLDRELSREVTGEEGALAHPALVWDVAIGQSTAVTRRVIGNLFYRGLVLRRQVRIGDTLRTDVEVVGLRQNRRRPGRRPTGLAVLRIRTTDQEDRPVLDFLRCAMLPLGDPEAETGHRDELEQFDAPLDTAALATAFTGWHLDRFRGAVRPPRPDDLAAGSRWASSGGQVVADAPHLGRLTLNVAHAHYDAGSTGRGRRLVYGGHTIGIAAAQVARALPWLITIVAWHGCDHLGPVFEGDTLHTEIALERVERIGDITLLHLRAETAAERNDGPAAVLDWRFVGVAA